MTEPLIIQQKIKTSDGRYEIREYRRQAFLGKGGFAKCYQAMQLENQKKVALKIVSKASLTKNRAKQKLLSQIKIHRALHHPYIVEFDTVFEDENFVYIVLELCPSGTLSEKLKKKHQFTAAQTCFYIKQLLNALTYLHSNKVIHRDLKMGNIFLSDSMDVKLGDFGLSAKLEFLDERKRTMAGTPNYIAPEIIDGSGGHSYEVDLWSTGVICYALLFGKPPFETQDLRMTYNKIRNCEYSFPSTPNVSAEAKDFIKRILVLDPKKRLTIEEMLEHPFLNQTGQGQKTSAFQQQSIHRLKKQANPPTSIELPKNNILPPRILTPVNSNAPQHKSEQVIKSHQLQIPSELVETFSLIIRSYVDYSTKYGMGYFLANGCYGVYFNDSTLMWYNPSISKYHYIQNPSHSDQVSTYSPETLPSDRNFSKKKMLLHKFEGHLREHNLEITTPKLKNSSIYVKQWLKTKHAIMFRLSNKIFQVDFFDSSQILLETESKTVLFTSKKGEPQFMPLNEVLNDNVKDTELGRRIKYTREILNSLKKEKENSS